MRKVDPVRAFGWNRQPRTGAGVAQPSSDF
jgi:hypothetical protein